MPNGRGLRVPGEAPAVLLRRGWNAANMQRSEAGARRQVAAATWALNILGKDASERQIAVARLRIDNPRMSLTELAAKAGVTKDTYAGKLRRLDLAARRKLSGEIPWVTARQGRRA